MTNTIINAKGLSCPQPVLLTLAAIKKGEKNFTVLVDREVAKENVLRCIAKNKLNNSVREENGGYVIEVSE